MLAPEYELDLTTQFWVIAIFNWIRYQYVTSWQPLTLLYTAPRHHWSSQCGRLLYTVSVLVIV